MPTYCIQQNNVFVGETFFRQKLHIILLEYGNVFLERSWECMDGLDYFTRDS